MKTLVYIVCLVSFGIFFVIIAKRDSCSDADVVMQEESTTKIQSDRIIATTSKSVTTETRGGETEKSTETKSLNTTVYTDVIHITEENNQKSMPVVQPPLATKAKTKAETHLTITKIQSEADKSAPSAVPVVTPEDVEKLNTEALAYAIEEKEKREPFFRFYKDGRFNKIYFEGTIRAASSIPDPAKNDYDNCLYTLFVEINSLFSEITSDMKISSEIILVAPIMKDKIIFHDNELLPGDKIWCSCAEYDTMPQDIQEIQISDDIHSYEHQQFYSLTIKKISAFRKGGSRDFFKREITFFPIQSLPKDEKADQIRLERIQSEITRIENELKQHGGSFATWKEEYKPIAEKYKHLADESYSCWINDSFFAAGGGADGNESSYSTKDYIESILPYKDYLKKNNIDLIIMRVPTRGDFAARVLTSDEFQENPAWVEHYYECLKNDIEIVDPMPEMWNHRFDLPLFYYYTTQDEYHPYEGTYYYSSVALAKVLKRYQYKKLNQTLELQRVKTKGNDIIFHYPDGNPKYSFSNIDYNHVISGETILDKLETNSGSPFIFLSNSFFGKYLIKDLGLPLYCAYHLQTLPDWFYQQSLGPSMLYNLVSSPDLLANRRVVIMIGCSHRGLFGKFHELPKYILDNAKRISLEKTIAVIDSPDLSIVDKESLTIVPDENGGTMIKPNKGNRFSFVLTIPQHEGKNTCMVRINFVKSGLCTFTTYDMDKNEMIESNVQIASGDNNHQDLFIPIANASKKVKIIFSKRGLQNQTIRNIELWYY